MAARTAADCGSVHRFTEMHAYWVGCSSSRDSFLPCWCWPGCGTTTAPTPPSRASQPASNSLTILPPSRFLGTLLSQSAPVSSAFREGLLNTLRVSLAGIVATTILGTLIGIGRLSRNWVVNKLATVYVEAVRNIPLYVFLLADQPDRGTGDVASYRERVATAWDQRLLQPGDCHPVVRGFGMGSGWSIGFGRVSGDGLVARWRRSVADLQGAAAHAGIWAANAFALVLALGWLLFGYAVTTPFLEGRSIAGGMNVASAFFALFPSAGCLYVESRGRDRTRVNSGSSQRPG